MQPFPYSGASFVEEEAVAARVLHGVTASKCIICFRFCVVTDALFEFMEEVLLMETVDELIIPDLLVRLTELNPEWSWSLVPGFAISIFNRLSSCSVEMDVDNCSELVVG